MDFFAQIITWINVLTNTLGRFVLAPVGFLPGWLSNTIISAVTGIVLLIIFKYTSNQNAIGSVKDGIWANLMALWLFKDSVAVTLKSQGRVFKGAFLLLFHSLRPMLVMIVPVCLLIFQMGLWYQYRPLQIAEQTLVTMELNEKTSSNQPKINLEPDPAYEIVTGPVRLVSKNQICWQIKVVENGSHKLIFQADRKKFEKELAVGNGFMRLSSKRPDQNWADILLHPAEKPFTSDEVVKSISIEYPDRQSWTSGTDWWLIYFFIASMVFALMFKPFLNVKI